MENENKNPIPASQNDDWLDAILGKQNVPKELGPDELAIKAAGLKHPDELDLDRIVQETLAEHWPEEKKDTEPAYTPMQEFVPAFEDVVAPEVASTVTEEDFDSTRQFTVIEEPIAPAAAESQLVEEASAYVAPAIEPEIEQPAVAESHEVEAVLDYFNQLEQENEDAKKHEEERLSRLVRPAKKNKYGLLGIPHILATVAWILMILFIGTSIGHLGWICAAELLALGKEPITATIVITEEDDIDSIAEKLQTAGLIRYPGLFKSFAELTGKGEHIMENGTITFDDKLVYDYNALINALSYKGGSMILVDVMIPEGYNCAQIFALLEEKGVCDAEDLERYVESLGNEDPYSEGGKEKARLCSDYWFLRYNVEFGHKYALEGFLFPDTYEFYIDEDPDKVIEKLLDGFNYRFSQEMIDLFAEFQKETGSKYSLYDVIIMASVIEKESANSDESYLIASVFYNRLSDPNYLRLESDATILYDTDFRSKDELITDEQINESPYNTYRNYGLPPTPITNPGMASLKAALDPETTDYRFFVFDEGAGVHRFSTTLAEHESWVSRLGL